ncbi:hypothetical protein GH714_029867 [Hevea brasiliensis]|uniref:Uncharacterized protein n=1 Tax=Hevea brasiliensis TaxID=3981 RepID=A0A6A6N3G7_HEVBR|nr:hypothetical protein GH714_029867 [Hevea brasiliensis]
MVSLVVLDLSGNSLSGSIPSSIGNCSFLNAMDLSFNKLSGEIPLSFSRLNQLRSLHLSNNKLTGSLPSSFLNLSNLETLDLGNNRLSCEIPPWIGSGFADLRILSLRSNAFFGEIPSTLSNLSSLQVLDLAKNNLAGSIPVTFGDFKAMSLEQYINEYLPYGKYRGVYYEESLIVNIKDGGGGSIVEDSSDGFSDMWFYLSIGLGFAVGIVAISKPNFIKCFSANPVEVSFI